VRTAYSVIDLFFFFHLETVSYFRGWGTGKICTPAAVLITVQFGCWPLALKFEKKFRHSSGKNGHFLRKHLHACPYIMKLKTLLNYRKNSFFKNFGS